MITPWVGVLTHLKGIKSAPQHAIAVDRACWQGEAVCAVIARTRAEAEDACELVEVAYEQLPAVTDAETALDPGTLVIHPELGDNLTFERVHVAGDPDKGFASADAVVETTFVFGRHTGVCNEPRAIVADWNPGEQRLTVYHGTQAPHMMQNLFAKHLALEEHQVRVVTKDVGGSFGIKVHTYADEMATVALSKLLKRPIKFVADRIESFVTDIHARDHRVKARIGVKNDGTITAWEIDDLTGIGPYSVYPRTSGIEANQIVNLTGAPYTCPNYRARARVVFQNKNVMCQYRAVGHPIATAVTEGLVELAAARIGMDPLEIRRRNLIRRRRPSVRRALRDQVRGAVAARVARASRRHDELCGPARRAEAAARARHLSRHRLCDLRRGDQSERRFLRRRRRQDLRAGRRHHQARRPGRHHLPDRRHRAGPGRRGRDRAGGGFGLRRADRARARDHRRHRQYALWRRHLGLARRRHRRRSRLAGRQGAARQRARLRGQHLAGDPERPRHRQRRRGRPRQRDRAPSAQRARPHRLFPPRHAAARLPGRADGDAPLRAARLAVRLHQRHPGELPRGRRRVAASSR